MRHRPRNYLTSLKDAELFTIYLLRRAQGRGVGIALFNQLVESLLPNGFKSTAAWVLEQFLEPLLSEDRCSASSSRDMDIGGAMLRVLA